MPILAAINLDHPCRYRALKMELDTSKREREAGELSVKREIAATQADAASLLSATLPKKACVGGRQHDTASTDGVTSVENSLGFETVARKHHRVLPQQQDIHAAMMRPSIGGDLRKANHTALATAIAGFSIRTTLVTTLLNLNAGCMC